MTYPAHTVILVFLNYKVIVFQIQIDLNVKNKQRKERESLENKRKKTLDLFCLFVGLYKTERDPFK